MLDRALGQGPMTANVRVQPLRLCWIATITGGGCPGTGLVMPHRRRKGESLPSWREAHNRSHKQVRARVEQVAWIAGCPPLHRRYERKADHFLAFTSIACTLICYRRLLPTGSRKAQVLAAP